MFDIWSKQPKIFAIGDIHGKWQTIRDFYLTNKIQEKIKREERDNNILILLGDAGLNYFFNYRDEQVKKQLGKFPFTYFVIRGNHEERPSICAAKNPELWHTETYWGNIVYVENQFPYIKYALDEVSLYEIPYIKGYCDGTKENEYNDEGMPFWSTYKTLVIPGAYSVDKYHRLQNGWSWFEGEQLTAVEMERGLDLINSFGNEVDLVLSHTCPILFEPTDLFLSFIDQNMVDKTMERYLGQIEYQLQYNTWLWGHFHATREYPRIEGQPYKKVMLYDKEVLKVIDYLKDNEINPNNFLSVK